MAESRQIEEMAEKCAKGMLETLQVVLHFARRSYPVDCVMNGLRVRLPPGIIPETRFLLTLLLRFVPLGRRDHLLDVLWSHNPIPLMIGDHLTPLQYIGTRHDLQLGVLSGRVDADE